MYENQGIINAIDVGGTNQKENLRWAITEKQAKGHSLFTGCYQFDNCVGIGMVYVVSSGSVLGLRYH